MSVSSSLSTDGTLTFSGTGNIADCRSTSERWYDSSRSLIKSVVVEDGITYIGNRAFLYLYNLTNALIGSGVTKMYIGSGIFDGCVRLKNIIVSEENAMYSSQNGVLYNKDKTVLQCCPIAYEQTNIMIPSTVVCIAGYAFQACASLAEIEIPDSVQEIDVGAFWNCPTLSNLIIGNGVTDIGYYAFEGCSSLTSVTMGSNVTVIKDRAFSNCTALTEINYLGTQEQWKAITIGSDNTPFTGAIVHGVDFVLMGAENVKESQLYQNANGYIRYADSTYNNSGDANSSTQNALAIFNVSAGEAYRVSVHMLTRFRVGTLTALVSKAVVQNLWIADGDTNGTTVIDEDRTHEITIPDGMNYLLVSYWSGSAGAWESTWDSLTVEKINRAVPMGITVTPPTKLTYGFGEPLNMTGMVMTLQYSDGTENEVSSGYTSSGFDSTQNGKQLITVTYCGFAAQFEITIDTSVRTVAGIEITALPSKCEYKQGEDFQPAGLIVSAVMRDGIVSQITNYTLSGFDSSQLGSQTITAAYLTFTAAFEVRIVRNTISVACGSPTAADVVGVYDCYTKVLTFSGTGATADFIQTTSPFAAYRTEMKTVIFGEGISRIGNYLLYKRTALENTQLPSTILSVGEHAFSDCTSLSSLTFAFAITEISSSAFQNCTALTAICIDQEYDSISGSPWAAENAAVTWNTAPLDRLEILTLPTKMEYHYRDSFDGTGICVRVYYTDGVYKDISDISELFFAGYDAMKSGTQNVTVAYRTVSADITITVTVNMTALKIITSPTKTIYAQNESQDYTGLSVAACYEDGSTTVLSDGYTVSDIDFTFAGNQDITVKYGKFSAAFQIQGDFAVPLKKLLNAWKNMTLIFDETTIAATNVIEGVDWFRFNGVTASSIYLYRSGWFGFGVSEAQMKIRYGAGYGARRVYRQIGHLTNGHQFLKLRIEHYTESTISNNFSGCYFNYELYLFDDNSIFFHPVYYPTVSPYAGTFGLTCGEEVLTFRMYAYSLEYNHLSNDYSFYSFGAGRTGWKMSNYLHKYMILGIKISSNSRIKTTYEIGESLNLDDVYLYREIVEGAEYYDDYLLLSDCTVSGFNSDKIGTQTIVITYADPASGAVYTTSFEVRVLGGTYTVKFLSYSGSTLKRQSVEYGNSATAPTPPAVAGYDFLTWSTSFGYITSNLTVSAIYRALDAAFATVIYNAAHKELGRIYRVIRASVTRKLSGACIFEITTNTQAVSFIRIDHRLEVEGLIFNITEIKKQTQSGAYFTTIQGEHITYILNDDAYKLEELDFTGSPSGCLARLLSGTPFHVGTVDFTENVTLRINRECTRRSAVMQLVALCGGEIDYDGYNINILRHVGKPNVIELMSTENVTDLSVSTSADGTVTYDVTLYRRMSIELGTHEDFDRF